MKRHLLTLSIAELARPIRYREIHFKTGHLFWSFELLVIFAKKFFDLNLQVTRKWIDLNYYF